MSCPRCLRFRSARGMKSSPSRRELRHISSYLFITNMIYSKKFEYAIECDPVLYSYRTLKLLLQPLAENAIAHAIPMPAAEGLIYRCAFIEDGGPALYCPCRTSAGESTRKPLIKLRSSWEQPPTRTTGIPGMGSTNVNERIHILFGSSYRSDRHVRAGFWHRSNRKDSQTKGDDIFVPGNAL